VTNRELIEMWDIEWGPAVRSLVYGLDILDEDNEVRPEILTVERKAQ
jgi:hypothetical protein